MRWRRAPPPPKALCPMLPARNSCFRGQPAHRPGRNNPKCCRNDGLEQNELPARCRREQRGVPAACRWGTKRSAGEEPVGNNSACRRGAGGEQHQVSAKDRRGVRRRKRLSKSTILVRCSLDYVAVACGAPPRHFPVLPPALPPEPRNVPPWHFPGCLLCSPGTWPEIRLFPPGTSGALSPACGAASRRVVEAQAILDVGREIARATHSKTKSGKQAARHLSESNQLRSSVPAPDCPRASAKINFEHSKLAQHTSMEL